MPKKYKEFEHVYIECVCDCQEHVLRITFDPNICEDHCGGDLWTEVYLNKKLPWYKRIWLAVKYMFGYQSRFGAFDNITLKPEHYNKLRELLNKSEQIKLIQEYLRLNIISTNTQIRQKKDEYLNEMRDIYSQLTDESKQLVSENLEDEKRNI